MPPQQPPPVIDAEATHQHAASLGGNITQYVLLAFRYLSALAAVFQGLATGNLDQTIRGIRIGHDIYDLEVKATKRTAAPAPTP